MQHRTVSLLIAALMASGMTLAASTVPSLKIAGLTRQAVTVDQGTQVIGLLLYARNIVAGLPVQTRDPLPCKPGSLLLGSLPERQGFAAVRSSLTGQGWQLVQAVPGRSGKDVAFQVRKGGVTALGLWAPREASPDGALLLCEQAEIWKPEAALKAPSKSAPLGATLKLTVKGWKAGAQPLRAVLMTGVSGPSGTISAAGQVQLPLAAPPAAQLLPMTKWRQAFDVLECADGNGTSLRGTVKISDPTVKFIALRKFTTGPASAGTRMLLRDGNINMSGTKSVNTPLIYTSAPVRLSGRMTCGSGDRNLTVDLSLPGGWTAVTFLVDLPDFGKVTQQIMNFTGQWEWEGQEP